MSEDKFAILVVFGSAVAIVVISLLYSLIRTWIKSRKNSYDEEKFDRLAKAFIHYKKETSRRLQQLESGRFSGDETRAGKDEFSAPESIEIDDQPPSTSCDSAPSGKLRNMLSNKPNEYPG